MRSEREKLSVFVARRFCEVDQQLRDIKEAVDLLLKAKELDDA